MNAITLRSRAIFFLKNHVNFSANACTFCLRKNEMDFSKKGLEMHAIIVELISRKKDCFLHLANTLLSLLLLLLFLRT